MLSGGFDIGGLRGIQEGKSMMPIYFCIFVLLFSFYSLVFFQLVNLESLQLYNQRLVILR